MAFAPNLLLFSVPSSSHMVRSIMHLLLGIHAAQRLKQVGVHEIDRLLDPLAAVAGFITSSRNLHRLMRPR